jgi:uncharacterized protein (UPF0335 family)
MTDDTEAGLPDIGGNMTALKRDIKKAVNEIEGMKDRRSSINADKAAIIERLEAQGINRHALKAVMTYAQMDASGRKNYDLSTQLAREALNLPIQGDLFETPAQAAE